MATQTASPRTRKPSTPKPAKVALLHRHDDGTMHAKSSDGKTVYTITNTAAGAWSCTCPAGRNGRTCYHVTTAMQRFAGFFPLPAKPVPAGTGFAVCLCDSIGPLPECPFHGQPAAPARKLNANDLLYPDW
jgi:hypothetical protein